MFRTNPWILRIGLFVILALLVCLGILGVVSQSQAKDASGLSFDLYPSSQEVPFACLGKPLKGWFIVSSTTKEPSLSDPLVPLTSSQIQVWTTPPLVGTMSKDTWSIKGSYASSGFTYNPAKTGSEHLLFFAMILSSPDSQLEKYIDFEVINCHYRITIKGEFTNTQGQINSNIFYNGDGYLDLIQDGNGSGWSIIGRGTTTLEEYVDGTEGDVTCVTTSPGKGASSFWVEGEADPSGNLRPVFHFADIITSVGQTCTDKGKGKTMSGTIPMTGWLPNSGGGGVVGDMEFLSLGEDKTLDISKVNDMRWVSGGNTGTMSISIQPETSK